MNCSKSLRALIASCHPAVLAFLFLATHHVFAMARPPQDEDSNIRVVIYRDLSKATLAGLVVNIYDTSEKLLGQIQSPVVITSDGSGLSINFKRVPQRVLMFTADHPLRVQNKSYRGKVIAFYNAGTLLIVNELPIENYLCSVISSEMPKDAPLEALKAQAIAARTFALFHKNQNGKLPYDLDLPSKTQAYRGVEAENIIGEKAIKETNGIVLEYKKMPFPSFFHTRCGGYTCSASEIWKFAGESPPGVECQGCLATEEGNWKFQLSAVKFQKLLFKTGYRLPNRFKIGIDRDSTSRVKFVRVNDLKISAEELRHIIGPDNLRSSFFKLQVRRNNVCFYGRGWGHGVGLCQYGAVRMAENGAHYKKILKCYYPGTRLSKAL